jgi:AcrR family transcriptional regulator
MISAKRDTRTRALAPQRSNIDSKRRAQIGAQRRARTRQKILHAAFELLGREHGRLTRTDEICDTAHVSRGTLYNHFTGIEELFTTLSHEISHQYNLLVHQVIADLPSSADRAASAVRYYLHRAQSDPSWGWAMVNLSAAGPIFGAETFRRATASVAQGIKEGDFHVPSVQVGRDLLLGSTLASMITILRSRARDVSPEKMVRQILIGLGVRQRVIERSLRHPLPEARPPSLAGSGEAK